MNKKPLLPLLALLSISCVAFFGSKQKSVGQSQSTAETPNLIRTFSKDSVADNFSQAIFSPSGKAVAVTHYDSQTSESYIALHDVQTWKVIHTVPHQNLIGEDFVFSPDGKWIVSPNRNYVGIFDAITGKLSRKLAYLPHQNSHYDVKVTFSPDGKFLAAVEWPIGQVLVWEFASGAQLWAHKGESQDMAGLAFSPDSDTLAGAGIGQRAEKRMLIWKARSGRLIRAVKGAAFLVDAPIKYSPDGKTIATSGFPPTYQDAPNIGGLDGDVAMAQDSFVMLWNARTGKLNRVMREAPYPKQSQSYFPLGFSSDGSKVVVAGNSRIDTRDVATGRILQSIDTGGAESVKVLSPDGSVALTDVWPKHRGIGVAFWRVN